MAPKSKKNVDKTPSLGKKAQAKKIAKLKVKKEKPKLRIPTVVKLKIQTSSLTPKLNNVDKNMPTKSELNNVDKNMPTKSVVKNMPTKSAVKKMLTKSVYCKNETTPRDTRNRKKMLLTTADKLELANEVAREQLVKSNPESQYEVTPTCVTVPTVQKTVNNTETGKRRGRKKKVLSESTDNVTASSVTDSEVSRGQLVKIKQESQCEVTPTCVTVPTVQKTVNNTETGKRRGRKKKVLSESTDNVTASSVTDSEVSREQLVKSNPESQCEVTPTCVTVPTVQKTVNNTETGKKRGRMKKVLSETTDNVTASSVTDSEEAFDVTPKKRKYVRKTPIVPTVQAKKKPILIRKNRALEEKKASSLSLKKNLKQTKITDLATGLVENSETTGIVKNNECAKTPVKNEAVIRAPKTRRRQFIARKGKPDANNMSTLDVLMSPSLLDQVESVRKDIILPFESPIAGNIKACTINSRKTSTTATSECLSWTKDISDSSTTTCVAVCSNDFVRIDKKLPFVKLTQTRHISPVTKPTIVENSELSSDSDSSSSEMTPRTPRCEFSPDIDSHSLDLSTSSVTPNKSQVSHANFKENVIATAVDKIKAKLKNFDVEINNWIGYDNDDVDVKVKKFQERILKLLKEESEVVAHCHGLKKDLSGDVEEENEHINENVEDFIVPVNASQNNMFGEERHSVSNVNNYINKDTNSTPNTSERSKDKENQITTEFKYKVPYDYNYDDDDALSLFAESITGTEPSRRNSVVAAISDPSISRFEEYVPKPVRTTRWEPASKISYVPSKITSIDVQNIEIKKNVCEKQSADSTSISKKIERKLLVVNNAPPAKNDANDLGQLSACVTVEKKKPCLMASIFYKLRRKKCMLFNEVCFFNIVDSCKNQLCWYPHHVPEPHEIKMKLARFSEQDFIADYMLLRGWPTLRRKYGMCFVEECKKRELTRILVEMAIDFYFKVNDKCHEDATLLILVIESILLYLNTVNLETCDDLLLFYFVRKGLMLCDVFMDVIANTQNFSRFKQVFINLTNFIVYHQKKFSLEVATHILERVCILPCEQSLTKALFQVVKNTDQAIFENSMIELFEKQLSSVDSELYEQCLLLKKQAVVNKPVLKNLFETSPHLNSEKVVINTSLVPTEREKRYTSPDTTNLDNMNKPVDEPIITRTIDFNRAKRFSDVQRSFSNSNSSMSNDSNEEFRAQPAPKPPSYQTWKGLNVFDKIRGRSPAPRQGVYMRPKLIQRRIHQQLNYGPGSTFPRRPGPNFF